MNSRSSYGASSTPLRDGLAHYGGWLGEGPAIVSGDFNHNAIWDEGSRQPFRELAAGLAELGLVSAYHELTHWREIRCGNAAHAQLAVREGIPHRLHLHPAQLVRERSASLRRLD
jgi:hypothetical protein